MGMIVLGKERMKLWSVVVMNVSI